MIVILANCITLAMANPRYEDDPDKAWLADLLQVSELFFAVVFTLEMLLKFAALTVRGYFSDNWNVLDFIIVIGGYLMFIPGVANFTGVRILRVLRPLRSLNKLPGLQVIVQTLLGSVRGLVEVFSIVIFFFVIFAIIAIQLWNGSLHQRCFHPADLTFSSPGEYCSTTGLGYSCPDPLRCLPHGSAPNFGLTGFDNAGQAMLTIYNCVTLSGWSRLMFRVQDTSSRWAWLYFVLLTLVISFFALNLVLAVVDEVFSGFQDTQTRLKNERNLHDAQQLELLAPDRPSSVQSNTSRASTPGLTDHQQALRVLHAARQRFEKRMAYLATKPAAFTQVFRVVETAVFQNLVILVIVVNTVFLSLEHHGMSDSFKRTLDAGNLVFTAIFSVEMVLKLAAYGPRGYVADAWNAFDGFIVIVSWIELAAGGEGALSVFRTFRLLRVFKLAKSVKSLRILLNAVSSSMASVGYMTLLLLLFMFMFAVLGMQVFSGAYDLDADALPEDRQHLRSRFDTFYWSLITVFQVLTGDSWGEMMGESVNATSHLAIAYYVLLTLLGGFLIVALFISILLSGFALADDKAFRLDELAEKAEQVAHWDDQRGAAQHLVEELQRMQRHDERALIEEKERIKREKAYIRRMRGRSFGLRALSRHSSLRRFCWGLVHSWPFELFIFVSIAVNCGMLAMENPDASDAEKHAFYVGDLLFAVIFTVEMLLKWIAMGVYRGEGTYMHDKWNRLDAAVVLFSLVSLALPSLSALRSFRALRPLRIIVRSQQMKVIIASLYSALPAIANVFIFCIIFWLIFAILAVNLFGGRLYSCSIDVALNKAQCLAAGGSWVNAEYHYDNTLQSFITLFQVASLSGWGGLMYQAVDSTAHAAAPQHDARPAAAVFFVLFIIIGAFFTLNLFVGVVIDNFNRLKQRYDGSAFLTEEQRRWVAARKIINRVELSARVPLPSNPVRAVAYRVSQHGAFDPFIMAMIILNAAVMLVQHYRQSESVTDTLYWINIAFIVIFTVEAVLKIAALGWRVYWNDSWNKFDFVIVVASLVGLVANTGVGANVIRVFRIGRIFRLIKRAKTLKRMFDTLVVSLPSLWNIALLLVVIFFIFAVLGVAYFGEVARTDGGFTRHLNMDNFPQAMQSLYVMATGDAWEQVMIGARAEPPGCGRDGSCGSQWATLFFVGFMICGSLVMVNLYLAVILENFSDDDEEQIDETTLEKIRLWAESWNKYDPEASKTINALEFEDMMSEAPLPFGFGRRLPLLRAMRRLQRTNIPIFKVAQDDAFRGRVWKARFGPTLQQLVKVLVGDDDEDDGVADDEEEDDELDFPVERMSTGLSKSSAKVHPSSSAVSMSRVAFAVDGAAVDRPGSTTPDPVVSGMPLRKVPPGGIRDAWACECECVKRALGLTEDDTSTMEQWLAVKIMEVAFLAKKARRAAEAGEVLDDKQEYALAVMGQSTRAMAVDAFR